MGPIQAFYAIFFWLGERREEREGEEKQAGRKCKRNSQPSTDWRGVFVCYMSDKEETDECDGYARALVGAAAGSGAAPHRGCPSQDLPRRKQLPRTREGSFRVHELVCDAHQIHCLKESGVIWISVIADPISDSHIRVFVRLYSPRSFGGSWTFWERFMMSLNGDELIVNPKAHKNSNLAKYLGTIDGRFTPELMAQASRNKMQASFCRESLFPQIAVALDRSAFAVGRDEAICGEEGGGLASYGPQFGRGPQHGRVAA